jgi:hypothetical protein
MRWILIVALLLVPSIADARTNAKWRIMQGTGDYANKAYYAQASVQKASVQKAPVQKAPIQKTSTRRW